MSSESQFQKILQVLQRPINCLADDDRAIRSGGLNTIKTQLGKISKEDTYKLFNETKLNALLIKTLSDKIENIRQTALDVVELFINKQGPDGKNIYEQLIPSLIARLNETPVPEKSQQLRLKIISIFIRLIPYKQCFLKFLPEMASAIAKSLADDYDQIKNKSCELCNKLSQCLSHELGRHTTNIVHSLRANLSHQKFKVRKTSLETIGHVLATEGAGGNFEHVKVGLKASLSDKKKQVRDAAYDCVSQLLLRLGPKYMKEYEATLIGFLLMGLDDEVPETVDRVMQLLENCGAKLKEENGDGEMIDQQAK